jgi:hypothetical protein
MKNSDSVEILSRWKSERRFSISKCYGVGLSDVLVNLSEPLAVGSSCKNLKLGVNDLGTNPKSQRKKRGDGYELVPRGSRVVSSWEGVARLILARTRQSGMDPDR